MDATVRKVGRQRKTRQIIPQDPRTAVADLEPTEASPRKRNFLHNEVDKELLNVGHSSQDSNGILFVFVFFFLKECFILSGNYRLKLGHVTQPTANGAASRPASASSD